MRSSRPCRRETICVDHFGGIILMVSQLTSSRATDHRRSAFDETFKRWSVLMSKESDAGITLRPRHG